MVTVTFVVHYFSHIQWLKKDRLQRRSLKLVVFVLVLLVLIIFILVIFVLVVSILILLVLIVIHLKHPAFTIIICVGGVFILFFKQIFGVVKGCF
jgi:hypothetical protein